MRVAEKMHNWLRKVFRCSRIADRAESPVSDCFEALLAIVSGFRLRQMQHGGYYLGGRALKPENET
jgi:hypothetical protein